MIFDGRKIWKWNNLGKETGNNAGTFEFSLGEIGNKGIGEEDVGEKTDENQDIINDDLVNEDVSLRPESEVSEGKKQLSRR